MKKRNNIKNLIKELDSSIDVSKTKDEKQYENNFVNSSDSNHLKKINDKKKNKRIKKMDN